MHSDKVVTTADVLESIRRVRRVGRQRIVQDLEKREPDLAEHLLEELTLIHQKLADLGPTSRQLRRVYRRVELLAVVLVSTLETAQARMWMDFILTTKPYRTKPGMLHPVTPPSAEKPMTAVVSESDSSAETIAEPEASSSTPLMTTAPDPVADFMAQRRILLAMNNSRLTAHPDPTGPPFDPFPLPRLPITMVYWCQALCRVHLKRTRTRLIVLLLLDRAIGRWLPVVPTQVCTRSAARLVLRTTDLAPFAPTWLIAGSFQTTGDSHLPMAMQAVPHLDGLHVVRHVCSTWAFVRAGDQTSLADPATVTVDDFRQTLDATADRLSVR